MTRQPRGKKHPLVRDGVSQSGRYTPALDPDAAPIEDRTTPDLLAYLGRYSRLLVYTNDQNKPDGDWEDFLLTEPAVPLAIITTSEWERRQKQFEDLAEDAEEKIEEPDALRALLGEMGTAVAALVEELQSWIDLLTDHARLTETVLSPLIESSGEDNVESSVLAGPTGRLVDLVEEMGADIPENDSGFLLAPIADALAALETQLESWPDDRPAELLPLLGDLNQALLEVRSTVVATAQREFDKSLAADGSHKPHVGLLLAFLDLFANSRGEINGLTRRHLDFYYRDVLGLELREAEPDRAAVLIELAKTVDEHKLTAGTGFKAGKDASGTELVYELEEDFVANRAQVAQMRRIFVDLGPGVGRPVRADTVETPAEGETFAPFGGPDLAQADLGFALSSPIFRLSGGERTITISLDLSSSGATPPWSALKSSYGNGDEGALQTDLFDVDLTGEKGWLEGTVESVVLTPDSEDDDEAQLTLTVTPPEGEPVTDYAEDTHAAGISASYPVVRCRLSRTVEPYPHAALDHIEIAGCRLQVDVSELTNLTVQNDLGRLDPARPFHPFGTRPTVGSSLYVGSREALQKPLDSLTVRWAWQDAPADFADYYARYYTGGSPSWTVDVAVLHNRAWKAHDSGENLVSSGTPQTGITVPSTGAHVNLADIEFAPDMGELSEISPELERGFVRFTLTGPSFAFGHENYPLLYTDEVIEKTTRATAAAQTIQPPLLIKKAPLLEEKPEAEQIGEADLASPGAVLGGGGAAEEKELNPPYTPVFQSLSIDYTSSQDVSLSSKGDTSVLEFFHLHPFGANTVSLPVTENPELVPTYDREGYLYLGISDLEPPGNLSLLLQMAEGSGDPFSDMPDSVLWECLTTDGWEELGGEEILRDQTAELRGSGIITIAVPEKATDAGGPVPEDQHWLRVSVDNQREAINDLIGVHAQATSVVFQDNDNDPSHLEEALAAGSISKLKLSDPAVKSVSQPYASSDGRPQEQNESFDRRVSERLRHRDRAVTLWDYERLTLEEFPQLHKAKCLTHTAEDSEHAPGHVTLVVIPDLQNQNAPDPFKPAAGRETLQEVLEFLQARASAFADIQVVNPLYEEVRVTCEVTFTAKTDEGYARAQLNRDLQEFLTPWAFGGEDISFGGSVHGSVIVNFIEERSYVDFLTDFHLTHYVSESGESKLHEEDVQVVSATTSRSILVSHAGHSINKNAGSA